MQNLAEMLDNNEKIVWQGKPDKKVYIASYFVPFMFVFGFLSMFFLPFGMTFLALPLGLASGTEGGSAMWFEFASSFLCVLIPFVAVFGSVLFSMLVPIFAYRHVEYIITSKRVLISGGMIGRDIKMVDFDKLQNIEVNVGLIDKLMASGRTGALYFFSGEVTSTKNGYRAVKDKMIGINDPYEVFKLVKKVSHDIKTDIEYPNQMRPEHNPGYNTKYEAGSEEKK